MGLAVSVGILADLVENDPEGGEWVRESLSDVNTVLNENGLPVHHEPEELPELQNQAGCDSFPYSFLHHLRRAYAHSLAHPNVLVTPLAKGKDPTKDRRLAREMDMMSSHLLCHSDCEGFYLPIDFGDILIDETGQDRIPGGLLGSSYRLMEELIHVAPALGIALEDGHLSDGEAVRINNDAETEEGLWIEKMVWICHYDAARLSIEHQTAISYH